MEQPAVWEQDKCEDMSEEVSTGERPWETTPLPLPDLEFPCIGKDWHDVIGHCPGDLTWMPGVAGSREYERDGFYCEGCVHVAKRQAQKAGLQVVTGPTLEEELIRRGLGYMVDDAEWLPVLAPTLPVEWRNRRTWPAEPLKE